MISTGPVAALEAMQEDTRLLPGAIASAGRPLTVRVRALSTAEFGPLEAVILHVGDTATGRERETALPLDGGDLHLDRSWTPELPERRGYLRVSVRTRRGGESYHGLSNPVWLE